jgi:hypothetical protein
MSGRGVTQLKPRVSVGRRLTIRSSGHVRDKVKLQLQRAARSAKPLGGSVLTFRDPSELLVEVERAMDAVPLAKFFSDSAYKPLREAWCAAMLGMGIEKAGVECLVSVAAEEATDCDFFVRIDGEEHAFQSIEALREKRRRGDELKSDQPRAYKPAAGRLRGPQWVYDALQRKIQKNYSRARELGLLVYANFDAENLQFDSIDAACRELANPFASTYVVTSTHLCSLKSHAPLPDLQGWLEIRKRESYDV